MATQSTDTQVDRIAIANAVTTILRAIGEDPDREGLADTPRRVANFWAEFIDYDPGNVDVTFESVVTDQIVVVTIDQIWSLCEHHMLPFSCKVHIGYITEARVLGLSKFARIAQQHAHKLQIQERLVHDIADDVSVLTGSRDVAVYATGQHLCMLMRGIRTAGTMATSVMRGRFRENTSTRLEFFEMIRRYGGE